MENSIKGKDRDKSDNKVQIIDMYRCIDGDTEWRFFLIKN